MRKCFVLFGLVLVSFVMGQPSRASAGFDPYAESFHRLTVPSDAPQPFDADALANRPLSVDTQIFGADDRFQVTNTTGSPARNVAFLVGYDVYGNLDYSCSGSFLNYNVVLTAAHCLWHNGGWVPRLVVIPGASGLFWPYGVAYAASFSVPQGYATYDGTNAKYPYDFGLVYLNGAPFGSQLGPYLPLGVVGDNYFSQPQNAMATTGYPGDKPMGTMWATGSAVGWFDTTYLYEQLDIFEGQSGSPIYALDVNAVVLSSVMSVVSTGNGLYNRSVRFTDTVAGALQKYCTGNGCTFSVVHPSVTVAPQTLDLSMATTNAGNPGTAVATATVRDASGTAMAGQMVSFSVTGAGCTGSSPSSLTTGAGGTATWAVTLNRNLANTTCTVSATAGSATKSVTFSISPAVVQVGSVAVSMTPQLAVGQTATVTATVRDLSGVVTASGTTVTFVVTGPGNQVNPTVATTSSGIATTTVLAGPTVGSYTVTATAGGISGSATFSITAATTPVKYRLFVPQISPS